MSSGNHINKLRSLYLDQPGEVAIETLSLCNASCNFCPYPTLERKGDRMSDEMLDRILEELEAFEEPFIISPFKVNEPFLDKRLIPFCRRVPEKASLRLFTNGSPLNKKNIMAVESLERVLHLWISVNEIERHKEVMGIDLPEKNLDLLHELVEKKCFTKEVVVSAVDGTEGFTEYVAERWPLFRSFRVSKEGWLGDIETDHEVPHSPCARWFELSIISDGTISLCCMDGQAQFPIGHVNDGLLNVYNSPVWRERREKLLDRHEVYPCSTCTY